MNNFINNLNLIIRGPIVFQKILKVPFSDIELQPTQIWSSSIQMIQGGIRFLIVKCQKGSIINKFRFSTNFGKINSLKTTSPLALPKDLAKWNISISKIIEEDKVKNDILLINKFNNELYNLCSIYFEWNIADNNVLKI